MGSDVMDWQPIESAPKDGTRVLLAGKMLLDPREWFVVAGGWCENGNGGGPFWTDYSVQSWGYEEYAELDPTHWMPLPPPPA